MGRPKKEQMVEAVLVEANDPYDTLSEALGEAYAQAAEGKGFERHSRGEDFEEQTMFKIQELLAEHPCGHLAGQAIKKIVEAGRLVELKGVDAACAELDGAIVYTAGIKIALRKIVTD